MDWYQSEETIPVCQCVSWYFRWCWIFYSLRLRAAHASWKQLLAHLWAVLLQSSVQVSSQTSGRIRVQLFISNKQESTRVKGAHQSFSLRSSTLPVQNNPKTIPKLKQPALAQLSLYETTKSHQHHRHHHNHLCQNHHLRVRTKIIKHRDDWGQVGVHGRQYQLITHYQYHGKNTIAHARHCYKKLPCAAHVRP